MEQNVSERKEITRSWGISFDNSITTSPAEKVTTPIPISFPQHHKIQQYTFATK